MSDAAPGMTLTVYPEVRVGGRIQTGYRLDCRRTGLAHFLTVDELREAVRLASEALEEPAYRGRGRVNGAPS